MINEDEEKSGILVHFAKEEIWTISKGSTLMIFHKKGQQVLEFNYICPYKPTALIKLELENLIDVYYFFDSESSKAYEKTSEREVYNHQ